MTNIFETFSYVDKRGRELKDASYMDKDQPPAYMAVLRELAAVRRRIARLEYETVQLLRRAGATWQDIGDEFGISRQAARSRFSKPRERRAEDDK